LKDVKEYYTKTVRREWSRLTRDVYRRLEFQTTSFFLTKHLPPRGRVLDAGGGPGRYTVDLAGKGYHLTLLDLTPANLKFARRIISRRRLSANVDSLVEGNIDDMGAFSDDCFDGVLCLGGPLTHILSARKRKRAAEELLRVAKPGAPVFCSVMSRLGVFPIELADYQNEIGLPMFKEICDTGDYSGEYEFTACHFFLPEELRALFEEAGGETLEMAALEWMPSSFDGKLSRLSRDPKKWSAWMYAHRMYCTHPAAVGFSDHMLIVCRKKGASLQTHL
jgi:SAM-dependent methyltransferase